MRPELHQIELIERYLENKLSSEEKIAFELKLNQNSNFRKEVETQKVLTQSVKRVALAAIIQQGHQNYFTNNVSSWSWFSLNTFIVTVSLTAATITGFAVANSILSDNGSDEKLTKNVKHIAQTSETDNVKVKLKGSIVDTLVDADSLIDSIVVNDLPPVLVKKKASNEKVMMDSLLRNMYYQDSLVKAQNFGLLSNNELDGIQEEEKFESPFSKFAIKPMRKTFNALEGIETIYSPSGSKIKIPKNALRFPSGVKAVGEVVLIYREWRNAVDMAFSKIPMTYCSGEDTVNLESAGMFEIYVMKDGIVLELTEDFEVDIARSSSISQFDYFYLQDGEWEMKEESIEGKLMPNKEKIGGAFGSLSNKEYVKFERTYLGNRMSKYEGDFDLDGKEEVIYRGRSERKMKAYRIKEDERREVLGYFRDINSSLKELSENFVDDRWFEFSRKERPSFSFRLDKKDDEYKRIEWTVDNDSTGYRILNSKTKIVTKNDLGKIMPTEEMKFNGLINGLKSRYFGVYNCDQQRRIENKINVQPVFNITNSLSKVQPEMVILIDPVLNASLSFGPKNFVCNAKAENIVVIYDVKNRIYIAKDLKSQGVTSKGRHQIEVVDVTDKVNNIADLKDYLGLD